VEQVASSSYEPAAPGLVTCGSRRRARKNMTLHIPALLRCVSCWARARTQHQSRRQPARRRRPLPSPVVFHSGW
jgi:hypothetical protein